MRHCKILVSFFVALLVLVTSDSLSAQPRVQLGNDVFVKSHLSIVAGKRVGLITNHTGRLSSGEYLVDVLLGSKVSVVALFGPEHGVRGIAEAGEKVTDEKDAKTGIPVFSLYGKTSKPTPEMLTNIDVLIYDIQDVGVRFYTYISTMGLCMEAAAEKGIPFVVLDRPNPIGGEKIDGPIIDDSLKSFVGKYSIPIVYGLTCGELATMINEEQWLTHRVHCDLTVIKMEGWKRSMTWKETGLEWIPPSPNIKTSAAALAYPATCLIEAANISEGRGSESPFQLIGAPYMDGEKVEKAMVSLDLAGIRFKSATFTPKSSKFANEKCNGIHVEVVDWNDFHPIATGLQLLRQAGLLYPALVEIRESSMLRLFGSREGYNKFRKGDRIEDIIEGLRIHITEFRRISSKYLLYRG